MESTTDVAAVARVDDLPRPMSLRVLPTIDPVQHALCSKQRC
jgi:hypothetical protein